MESSPRRPVSPAFSSPSVYSRAHTCIGPTSPSSSSILSHYPNPIATRTRLATRLQQMATLSDGEETEEDRDLSPSVSRGPRLTKYADLPLDDPSSPGSSVTSFARSMTKKAAKHLDRGYSSLSAGGLGDLDFSVGGGGIPRLNNPSEISLVSGTSNTSGTSSRSAKTATLAAASALQNAKSFLASFSGQSIASSSHSSSGTGSTGDDNSLIITPNGVTTTYRAPSIHGTPTPTPSKTSPVPLLANPPSLASTLTSTPTPAPSVDAAKLEPSLFSLSPNPSTDSWKATDRPLLSSGSPGFGLISLEVAQERERERAVRKAASSTPAASTPITRGILKSRKKSMATAELQALANDPTHPGSPPKLKGKKSLMKLFKGHSGTPSLSGRTALKIGDPMPMSIIPPLPPLPAIGGDGTPQGSTAWSEDGVGVAVWPKSAETLRPKLELRPVSMSFARGLPTDYLAGMDDDPPVPVVDKAKARRQSVSAVRSPRATSGSGISNEHQANGTTATATNAILSPRSSGRFGIPIPSSLQDTASATDAASTTASLGSATSSGSNHTTSDDPIEHISLQIANARKAWRVQISELSSQVRELREELDEARQASAKSAAAAAAGAGGCKRCQCACTTLSPRAAGRRSTITASTRAGAGQGTLRDVIAEMRKTDTEELDGLGRGKGVMDRGRVKTAGARGVFGSGSLYERE